MAERKFKKGDVVVLKSGSVKMTVIGYAEDNDENVYVSCEWYNSDKGFGNRNFVEDALEIYVEPQFFV